MRMGNIKINTKREENNDKRKIFPLGIIYSNSVTGGILSFKTNMDTDIPIMLIDEFENDFNIKIGDIEFSITKASSIPINEDETLDD
jgi:hypothetical protein